MNAPNDKVCIHLEVTGLKADPVWNGDQAAQPGKGTWHLPKPAHSFADPICMNCWGWLMDGAKWIRSAGALQPHVVCVVTSPGRHVVRVPLQVPLCAQATIFRAGASQRGSPARRCFCGTCSSMVAPGASRTSALQWCITNAAGTSSLVTRALGNPASCFSSRTVGETCSCCIASTLCRNGRASQSSCLPSKSTFGGGSSKVPAKEVRSRKPNIGDLPID